MIDRLASLEHPTVIEQRDGRLSSYKLIADVYGQPAALLEVHTPRDISALGARTVHAALVSLLLAGTVLATLIWTFLRRFVLSPIAGLTEHIARIRNSGDLSQRMGFDRLDEIGTLAGQFDSLTGELKSAHDEMASSRDAALEVSRLKSEFLATMNHEIRTPMNGVIGMTELLLSTRLDDRQRRFAETVRQSADSLLRIINDILDLSKIEAGKLDLEKTDFDLRKLLERTSAMFSEQAHAKGLEFAVRIPPSLDAACRGDPNRLRQVLVNLIGNAMKFTRQGEVIVRAQIHEQNDNVRSVRIEVKDTGIGIPAEKQRDIFESFSQADSSTTREYGGSGLGLAISKQLIEMMGGTIGVTSRPGEGSSFWFEVPLEHASALHPAGER